VLQCISITSHKQHNFVSLEINSTECVGILMSISASHQERHGFDSQSRDQLWWFKIL